MWLLPADSSTSSMWLVTRAPSVHLHLPVGRLEQKVGGGKVALVDQGYIST